MFKKLAFIFLLIVTTQWAWSQQIEIQGNGIVIANDGTNVPKISDHTLYDTTPVFATRFHTFTLINTHNKDARVESVRSDSKEFKVTEKIRRLRPGQSATFEVAFEPTSIGEFDALVSIKVKFGRRKKTFEFNISGESSEETGFPEIMISQYSDNGDADQIEIKNLTDYDITNKKYVLALYKSGDDLNKAPKKNHTIDIDRMEVAGVLVYSKFDLKGDEIVVISSSKGKNCYADRIDIIGEQNTLWGNNRSFSKGGCASESAHTEFSPEDWIQLTNTKVDLALANQNISIGTYHVGPIRWTNEGWTAGQLPDLTRLVYVDYPYSGGSGNIEACDLFVNAAIDFDEGGTNSVIVYRDLSINDVFEIGDKESLVMYDDDAAISGVIKKFENSTYRNNEYDFTYWSSPVANALASDVFAGVDQSRIYYFDQSKTDTSDPNHTDYYSTWVPASGKMFIGKGYATEGPKGTVGVHQLSFSGIPNNGIIRQQLVYHDDEDKNNDFNLLGNPYPSAIDIEKFFVLNEDVIDPVVYLWTHATAVDGESGDYSFDDYATYNMIGGAGVERGNAGSVIPTKNIGSSQGFFIRAKTNGEILFNNTMRMENANDQFFKIKDIKKRNKDLEKDRIWLDLTTNMGGFNQILIGFDSRATDEFDSGYDALKHEGGNKISFYSNLNGDKLTIQGLAAFNESKDVSLGFDTKLGHREYTISISGLEGQLRDADLILYDHLLNISHDLEKSVYNFTHHERGSFPGRFSLKLGRQAVLSVEDEPIQDELIISNQEDVFSVVATSEVSTVNLFDLQGRRIMQMQPNQKSFDFIESESKKGEIILLELQMKDQKRIVKKMYKQ